MTFHDSVKKVLNSKQYIRFDQYMIEKLGFSEKEDRHMIFREFRKRTNREDIASMPTMRLWFGMDRFKKPSRENAFHICFALGFSVEETEELLQKGLGEAGIQVNDYQELIFRYCLENGLHFDKALALGEMFEEALDTDITLSKTHSTEELMQQYERSKGLKPEDFLMWMTDRADWFKGYSQTALNYFLLMKKQIVSQIREDSQKMLEDYLRESGYYVWKGINARKHKGKSEKDRIHLFLKSEKNIKKYGFSEELKRIILELCRVVFAVKDTDSTLIAELYDKSHRKGTDKGDVPKQMSNKYLSDLLHIPEHKEKTMRVAKALRELERMNSSQPCPQWIVELGELCLKKKGDFSSVAAGIESLKYWKKENKRRCYIIQRDDLLPLIFHISQNASRKKEYKQAEARGSFVDLANTTLNACNMSGISENNMLDALLLQCFQEEDMYSFSELLENIQAAGQQ